MIYLHILTGKETAESIFNLRFKPQKVMHIPDNDVKIEKKLALPPVKKDKCYIVRSIN